MSNDRRGRGVCRAVLGCGRAVVQREQIRKVAVPASLLLLAGLIVAPAVLVLPASISHEPTALAAVQGTAASGSPALSLSGSTSSGGSCATAVNPIVCENQQPGTPSSQWDVSAGEGTTIQGFADPFSVNVGQSVNFKIQSAAASYQVDIYRMGYYGGDGARLVASITPNTTVSQNQPACSTNTTTGLVDCGNWGISATWNVPSTAISGVYFAHIYRTDGSSDENQIPFVVTNNASTSDLVFMSSDETWQAYNDWGGYSLYVGTSTGRPWCCTQLDPGRAVQVSYNRPFATRFDTPSGQDYFFYAEFPMIEFLEENGYNVTYVSQSNVAASGGAAMLEQHKALVTSGHSEYFDPDSRANITAARDAGVNLAFFSGNLMWWETRWASSQYGSEPYRTLITYKETLDNAATDPTDPPGWTGAWRDPRFTPPASGGQPENSLTGQLWMVNCCSYSDQVPYQYAKELLWRNTAVASLASGATYTMAPDTLGYEWDVDVDNGFRPAGEIDMSKTCENVSQLLLTVNENIGSGNACNSLTLYRAAGGGLVFDAGTVQWAWGLNSNHDGEPDSPDRAMQQATVNLMAMMGVQPATVMSGLVPGTTPQYTAPPTSTITAPVAGSVLANGSNVTISGAASDAGGGMVAGVEVSTDGGSTWHPVTTMSAAASSVTWSYTWSADGSGPVTLMTRATDDDANTGPASVGVGVTVNCPCGLFGANYVPATASSSDASAYELGVKFQSAVSGWVAGVRFYKGAGNLGTHTGALWSASGTLLASGSFTNETASGWQTLLFDNPVAISANTTYVASYWDPDGHYAVDQDLFDWTLRTPPLLGVRANYTASSGGNGVFNAGGSGFPTSMSGATSYGVDAIFDTSEPPGSPPAVTSVTPYPGSSSNPLSVTPTVTFTKPVVAGTGSFTVTDQAGNVAGTVTQDSAGSVLTFTPTSPLGPNTTYTVAVSGVQDQFGQSMTPNTYTFTTSKSYSSTNCPCTVWPDAAPSSVTDAQDVSSVNLGVDFTVAASGTISGIRFYKEPDNTGSHLGSLWSSAGALLATGTFSNESTEGWEELDFSTPVTVAAGQSFVASYFTSAGHYADTTNSLSAPVTSGGLTVPANGGVFAYAPGNAFPSSSYMASNYWVDVVYTPTPDPVAPTVTATTPLSGQGSVLTGTPVSFSFDKGVLSTTIQFTLAGPSGVAVAGGLSYDTATQTATFTPTASLLAGTTYTATVSGTQNISGVAMSPYTWSFITAQATAPPGQCPCSIWNDSTRPAVSSANDPSAVNLGVQFTTSESGWITGIRFYKGLGNTGTHIGSLWDSAGDLLGSVTFTNETTEGWQQANFSSPIPIAAGSTYTASYFAPNGGYAVDSGGLASSVTYGPLTAEASGGVYVYGSTTTLPVYSYNSGNYWVDVAFTTTAP